MNRFAMVLTLLLIQHLGGCATLSGGDSPNVSIVGLEPLPSEGLEVRFELSLRVQNPNESALAYDGISVKLDLDDRGVASGVSDTAGEISRFSDAVLTVPVSISAFSVVRQLWALTTDTQSTGGIIDKPIVYILNGKLGAPKGSLNATRFSDRGELDFFTSDGKNP